MKDLSNKFPVGAVFKFPVGTVFKFPKHIGEYGIVADHRHSHDGKYMICNWISVNSSSSSGSIPHETKIKIEECPCYLAYGDIDEECEDCDGSGKYRKTYNGLESCRVVASCVKDWIQETLLKGFKF